MLLYDTQPYLDWLESLRKGDDVYLFNARSFRRLHSSPTTLNKATKKTVGYEPSGDRLGSILANRTE
jgi:hypothetical protein